MADAYTALFNFTKPEVGGSRDVWGGKWNANLDEIDTILGTLAPKATPEFTGLTKLRGAANGLQLEYRDDLATNALLYADDDKFIVRDSVLAAALLTVPRSGDALIRTSPVITVANKATHLTDKADLAGATFTGDIQVKTAAPALVLRDTDAKGAFLHANSGLFYVFDTPIDSAVPGAAKLSLNLTSGDMTIPGALATSGINSTGTVGIVTTGTPTVRLNRTDVSDWNIQALSGGQLHLSNGGAYLQITNGGALVTNQMGDVYTHIENRASAYANSTANAMGNARVAAIALGSFFTSGALGFGGAYTAPPPGVCVGGDLIGGSYYFNQFYFRYIYYYTPNTGWILGTSI